MKLVGANMGRTIVMDVYCVRFYYVRVIYIYASFRCVALGIGNFIVMYQTIFVELSFEAKNLCCHLSLPPSGAIW